MNCKCNEVQDHQYFEYFMEPLKEIKNDPEKWSTLFKCLECNQLWLLSSPNTGLHGGGPEVLNKVTVAEAIEKFGSIN